MIRVKMDLGNLLTVANRSVQGQTVLHDEFLRSLAEQQKGLIDSLGKKYQQVDQLLSKMEETLKAQSAQIPVRLRPHFVDGSLGKLASIMVHIQEVWQSPTAWASQCFSMPLPFADPCVPVPPLTANICVTGNLGSRAWTAVFLAMWVYH
jgi:hypothetical protein